MTIAGLFGVIAGTDIVDAYTILLADRMMDYSRPAIASTIVDARYRQAEYSE